MNHILQSVLLRLLHQRRMLFAIAEDVDRQVFPLLAYRLQLIQHDIVALLMVQVSHRCNVDLLGVHLKVNGHFTLFEDLRGVDQVRDRSNLGLLQPGFIAEGLNDAIGHRHKLIEPMELVVEKRPQYPVPPFLPVFDLHIVVDPHDPFFRRNRQRSKRAVMLIVAEINGNIIGLVRGKPEPGHKAHNQRKGNQPE